MLVCWQFRYNLGIDVIPSIFVVLLNKYQHRDQLFLLKGY